MKNCYESHKTNIHSKMEIGQERRKILSIQELPNYEYEDGKKVVETSDHKVTAYPDGTIEADMGGGHKTVMSPDGVTKITFNFPAIKRVYPINVFNVTSLDTQNNGELTVKEITFINGGKLHVGYDKTGAVVNISANDVGELTSNKDGSEVGFDIGTKSAKN